ncbi:hypothetical protein AXW89_03560 [Pseudomonas aeruginosa]|nr:hypothetical protein AXW89_03560 [Pseudomonas aeruginosa]
MNLRLRPAVFRSGFQDVIHKTTGTAHIEVRAGLRKPKQIMGADPLFLGTTVVVQIDTILEVRGFEIIDERRPIGGPVAVVKLEISSPLMQRMCHCQDRRDANTTSK